VEEGARVVGLAGLTVGEDLVSAGYAARSALEDAGEQESKAWAQKRARMMIEYRWQQVLVCFSMDAGALPNLNDGVNDRRIGVFWQHCPASHEIAIDQN
jgi:hypothetical protein